MKKLFLYTALAAAFAALFSIGCRKIEVDDNILLLIHPVTIMAVVQLKTQFWKEGLLPTARYSAKYTYKLRGLVYVTNGAILTIEPGTKIVGENGQNGGLIITRGCKIIADGTADKPIVFTSEAATPQRGDWAGVGFIRSGPYQCFF